MKKLLCLLLLSWLAIGVSYSQAISPYLAGQNAWLPTALGMQVYNGQLDRLWPVVKQSKVRMIRIGGNGMNSNLVTNAQYIALIDSIRRIGAEPMVQVSEGRGRFTAAQAAQVVQHVNITMGRNIKYWIIGNEPDLNNTAQPNPVSVAGVAAYIKAFASAMKAVDPTILIVGPENASYGGGYFPSLVGGANDITGTDANGRYYIDVISFHSYAFNGTQTRAAVLGAAQTLTNNVTNLLGLMANANALHNRTGANALRWAVTEFNIGYANPTVNTVEGVGVHSFLNGQYWAEVFGVGMKYEGVSMQPWSIHEGSGARGTGDLGYLDGPTAATVKPRSSFWHEMLVSENLHGTNLNATDNQALVKVLSSTDNGTTAVMLLNESDVTDYDFTVQLDAATVPGAAPLKINVPAGINNFYNDKIYAQSTLVLLFNSQGALTRKIVYSLQHAQQTLPPTYLNPGQSITLASFSSDKTFTCVAPEAVTFTASVLGEATSLTWNFGTGATPATGTGKGPISVTYASAGNKTVSLTLVNADTTIVNTKVNYLPVSTCIRTPYPGTIPVIPGVVKAIEYDNGGENVAYHDTEVANRGAATDPNVPRANEGVDTSNSGEGIGEVGFTASTEWLKYTVNVLRTGLYRLTVRVSTGATSTGSVRLSVNDVDRTGVIPVPATGAFNTYQDLVINNVYLEASPNATLKFDIVSGGFNFSKLTFAEQPLTGIVVNRLYNGSSTADGATDAVELLVVQDHLDIRGLIMKDFETNLTSDTGGKIQFKDLALWKDLRIGTTIVLRRLSSGITGYAEDFDPSDFKIDLLMENATYLAALAPAGQNFNLTQTDMVLLKTGTASGTDNPVHAFATNAAGLAFYTAVTSPKLLLSAGLGTGAFVYPTNPAQSTADYNGTNVLTSTSASRNWGDGFGTPNITYINTLRGLAITAPPIVVNRIYNGSNDGNGNLDAVELLVVQDHLDVRGMIVKDFDVNGTADTGGKYQFTNNAFWSDLRSGTTIVLRQLAGPVGYVPDYDASDFTLDFFLGNTSYLTNVGGTNTFNITQFDMVMIKAAGSGSAGVTGAMHTFATRLALGGSVAAGTTANYQAVPNYKMAAPDLDNGGSPSKFIYPLNPTQTLADYNGAGKANASGSTALNWGYGFGTPNITYIQSLRNAVTGPDLVVTNGQSLSAGGTYNSITVQSGGTLTLQLNTTVATTVQVLTGGKLITSCQTLSGAGSFELQAGAELQICDPAGIATTGATGAIQLAGTRSFSPDGMYTYNGTAAQVTGAGLPSTVRSLTVNNTAALPANRTLTLSQAVSVVQLARLQSGNLNTAGQDFILLSSAAGTAVLDNTGGVVSGDGTMQRAITSTVTGPAYRHFSSPVANAPLSSVATAGFTPTFNTAYNTSTTPSAVSPFPTVFGYDEGRIATVTSNYGAFDKGWFSPAADTDIMQPTRGYTVNMPAPAAPVAFTGTFNNGTQNSGALNRGTDADAGWQLLGNPYPAPLNWSTVTPAQRPGMDAAMYVYQSSGQYTGTYRTFANGVGASPLVVAGSAYFARVSATGTPGAVNLTNANRVTTFDAQPAFGRGTADARPLLRLTLSGANLQDDAYVYFEQGATAGPDTEFDAAKLPNPSGLDLASLAGSTPMAINALAPLSNANVVVPLSLRVPQAGTFAIAVAELGNFGAARVYLRDALTGAQQLLAAGRRYQFPLSTLASSRFSLVFSPAAVTAAQAELTAGAVSLYPNPAHGSFTVLLPPLVGHQAVHATLLNALGQAVQARTIGLTPAGTTSEFNTRGLAAGVYILRLQADNQLLTKRVVIQ